MSRRCVPLTIAALLIALPALHAQGAGGFDAVDRWADAAPPAAEASIATLAAYLARAGDDELSRARALYRWVAGHVSYDAEGFRTRDYGDLSPEGVLRRRAAVCEGYARLTEALGTAMGLRIQVVSGWSKGYGYRAGQALDGPTNHAWNAVQIGGQWRLMDPTWGAGFLNERLQFVRRFQEHYFLTPPEAFVVDHLPEDARWQLLERPIDASEYAELAYLRPAFFANGLRVESHRRSRITASEPFTVTLGVTDPVELLAEMVDPNTGQKLEGTWAFAQVRDGRAEIHAAFPRPGEYLLRLFVRPRGSLELAQWALDYRVRGTRGGSDGFPASYRDFGATGAWLESPLEGTLAAGRSVRFRLSAPGATDVAIVMNNQWTHFGRTGDVFTAEVAPVAGAVTVFAKYADGAQYTGLLRYNAR